jgi:alpha-mannosidase
MANNTNLYHSIRWTSEKIRQRLRLIEPLVYCHREPLPPFRYHKLASPRVEPPLSPETDYGDWQSIDWGSTWGEPRTDFVLRTRFLLPPGWGSLAPAALSLPIGEIEDFSHPEALIYIDGQAYATCDRYHREIRLAQRWCDGLYHDLALHGWTGGMVGTDQALRFDLASEGGGYPTFPLHMGLCEVVQIHQPTRDFVALARVALGVADHLNENEPSRGYLYTALDEAFQQLDTREPWDEGFYASVPDAHRVLQDGISRSGAPLDVELTAAGHAHIDVAWLWTLDQTRRKAGRTFYNVLRLMDEFPEFRFTQSQAQLYEFVRQDYPDLFQAIQQRVAEGRWEPIGGTWVEADGNVTGAESLARQFLLGTAFFQQHLSQQVRTSVLWLPDVFGYAWNLPQLIKEAGLRYFFTIKIGWSQYNRFPYDSFWWQGLDGTRILTHFSPTQTSGSSFAGTYNATASPQEVLNTWTNFQQKDWGRPGAAPPLLLVYGYGDGGGGPSREMLENIHLMEAFPAAPRVQCSTVAEFFARLEATAGDRLPTWNGELYLEYHRGTYTTQARNKRANRKSEFLLHDAEFLASLAAILDAGYAYPHQDLRRAWELVCLNQFHDIIPGSSIGPVYEESLQQYAEIGKLGDQVKQGALQAIAGQAGGDLLVVNPTSFARRDLAFWAGGELSKSWHRADGSPAEIQACAGGLLLDAGELPPYSVTPLLSAPDHGDAGRAPKASALAASPTLLENDLLRAEFDAGADLVRLYDKANRREVLLPGAIANQLQAFEDRPRVPDAWDVDIYYDDRMWLAEPATSVRVIEAGPLRAALEVRRRILNSTLVQHISLGHNSPRLDFDTTIDWQERHVMLKVAFPVDVLSPTATYEIQWGNVQRPTHRNTSWDWARFETCAHKWADLSEGGYGVSLLNDCKYGHDVHDNVLRLTLLRSPTNPDPAADLGEHRFVYSLLPHAGGWGELTIAQAYALNNPLLIWPGRGGRIPERRRKPVTGKEWPATTCFLQVNPSNVIIETVKHAEDGLGLIVRLYESQRQRGEFNLVASIPLAEAWRTNLLEENQERLAVQGNCLKLWIHPYQIVTLRLLPE